MLGPGQVSGVISGDRALSLTTEFLCQQTHAEVATGSGLVDGGHNGGM